LYNKQVKARAIIRTRVKQEEVIEYQVYIVNIIKVKYKKKIIILKKDVMLILKKDNCVVVKYKQKPRIYISSSSHVQTSKTSAILAKTPKCGHLLGAPPQHARALSEGT